jgi:uncharacterized membrane protein
MAEKWNVIRESPFKGSWLMPFSPLRLLLLLAALVILIGFIQFGVVSIAFDRLGLSRESAYLLLMGTLIGSMANLPLFRTGKTLVLVNVGGALVPIAFCIYLIMHHPIGLVQIVLSVGIVAAVAHAFSRPLPGIGIGLPMFITPIAAALVAVVINPEQRAPLAYISGTLGVLIGADIIRLKDIRQMGAPFASIGGAGSFDGIFITGFIAVLLA